VHQTRVDLKTADGILDVHVVRPEGQGPWPAVVFYMDAFGIRQQLLDMASRLASGSASGSASGLAKSGYVVALPNLYYRSGDYPPLDPVLVAGGGAERDRFKGMIASISNGLVMRDTADILAHLDLDPHVAPGAKGVVGYCMGGGFALAAAGTFPDSVGVAASIHGGSLATDKPDSAHLLAGRIRGKVYVGVAGIDPSFPDEQRLRLEQAFEAANVDYSLEVYDGARHGFAVTGHLAYDRDASERHWATLVDLLVHSLQPGGLR
jgi:carboxymethylenebutenolidase